jgi:pilus assembly protein CpaB
VSHRPVLVSVRARRALARPVVRRALVVGLAAASGLVVTALVSSAEAARDRWGQLQVVAVATRDLAPGDVIDGSAVAQRRLPQAALPDAALAEVPHGSVVRQPVVAGEALVAERLAPQGLSGAAALVPAGQRAVALPPGPLATPPLAVGDLVDVLAVVPVAADGGAGEPAFTLVKAAMVVDVGESVSVAVPERDAARVAWAVVHGAVVLALAGP